MKELQGKENFKNYPKIVRIENDGKIIGLDKHGRVNTDFNTNTVSREEFLKVFNNDFSTLHENYVNENLSRYENNKESYNLDYIKPNEAPERFYNERDFKNDLDRQNELKKTKRKNKWLVIFLVFAVIIFAFLMIKNHFSAKEAETNQQNEVNNQQLQNEIEDTKSQLANSREGEQQTQNKINELQYKIDNMNENNNSQSENNHLQEGVNKLQDAQNSKINGNEDQVKQQLGKVDEAIKNEDIQGKVKNKWETFKGWLSENISF